MAQLFLRYPGGLAKALTFSYDDGVDQDIKFIEILDKNGLKGTFNLNSGRFAPEGKVYAPGQIHRPMCERQVRELYSKGGHEVAVHALTHPHLEHMPAERIAYEIVKDRENLESLFGKIIRGMAYPYGTHNDTVVEVLRACGILYSRTTAVTGSFNIPRDWLRLPATCKHTDPKLMEYARKFADMKVNKDPARLFYVWGHTYEFEGDDNWNVIEEFAEYTGGRDNVWYATNIEIYEYIEAYKKLVFSVDSSMIYNPTDRDLWCYNNKKTIRIPSGKTVCLEV